MRYLWRVLLRGGNKSSVKYVVAAAIIGVVLTVFGATTSEAFDASVGGYAAGWYYSSNRDLDDKENILGLTLQPTLDLRIMPELRFRGEGRIIAKTNDEEMEGILREGYGDYSWRDLDFRIGRQIIKWGRADTINPTDNLTPSDYTLLFPEDSDLQNGIDAVKGRYNVGNLGITAIWIPYFKPSRIPLTLPRNQVSDVRPASSLDNSEYALKIDQTGELLDWSISYFDGYDLIPDFGLRDKITLTYPRIKVIGADFAAGIGSYGVRGEAAYVVTDDSSGRLPLKKNSFFHYVVGVDKTYGDSLYVNLQYIQRIVIGFRSLQAVEHAQLRAIAVTGATVNNQLDEVTHSISLKVEYKMLHETMKAELSGIYNLTRNDYLLRPRVRYAISDRYTVTAGGDIYQGRKNSFFGFLKDNSLMFVELRIGF